MSLTLRAVTRTVSDRKVFKVWQAADLDGGAPTTKAFWKLTLSIEGIELGMMQGPVNNFETLLL